MNIFDNESWNIFSEGYGNEMDLQMVETYYSKLLCPNTKGGLLQPQIMIEPFIQPMIPYISAQQYYDTLILNKDKNCFRQKVVQPVILTTRKRHSNKRKQLTACYSRWSVEEDEKLRQAVKLHGPHKWSLIATHVPNRTPMQCSTRWLGALNPNIHRGRWTGDEDAVLRYSVLEYANTPDHKGKIQPIPWNRIAERIPNRTGIQCQARWTEALDPYVRKGKWSKEEDVLLLKGVQDMGRSWIKIAESIPGRTQRQCRTRWMQIHCKQDRKKRKNSVSSDDS